jgi:hypothetical protein
LDNEREREREKEEVMFKQKSDEPLRPKEQEVMKD